ncbi:uncharacterized protein LOC131635568 [Vicia villosa]|uniref:uncharacterized protein LOC131635568 n=1 Tax=Vicia villosa TaxID=3911 RepID=UPI00273C564E|nr:uncharacterized protein LOC131635568 [Vicia villosa]XP_058762183.1 uncharacterized protein LOC131635568 [Vicia villosa]XP_058762184.1 uncharacterized protein LOC131635568 [Vicia villosa]XP_058762185.1 uncharacterized protein LOC131635568 [Vicia villosa]
MHEFSTVDGFVEISECMADMIKYVANEPSVGLYFIQQHAQNAVPNVVKADKDIVEKVHETALSTEDLEDSITAVRSMKDCGFSIVDEMIGDINKSLEIMKTKKPKSGLTLSSTSTPRSQTERTNFWGNRSLYAQEGDDKKSNYFSNVLKTAKQKVSNLKWQQSDDKGPIYSKEEKLQYPDLPLSITSDGITSYVQATEPDELPVSSQVEDESQHLQTDDSEISIKLLSLSERFDDFKANKEAKLEEWLEGTSNHDDSCNTNDEKRVEKHLENGEKTKVGDGGF